MTTPNSDSALGRKLWALKQSIEYEKSLIKDAIGDELWQEMGFVFQIPTYYAVAVSEKYGVTLFTEKEDDGQTYYIKQRWWLDTVKRKGPDLDDCCKVTPEHADRLRDVLATMAGRTMIITENSAANQGSDSIGAASRESYREDIGRFLASMLSSMQD